MCRKLEGNIYQCNGNVNCANGNVWGTGTYTEDSNIFKAAQQMGLIPGKFMKIQIPGMDKYYGSTTNAVTSNGYNSYPNSYCLSKVRQDKNNQQKQMFETMKQIYVQEMKKYNQNVYKIIKDPGIKCVVCLQNNCTHLCLPCSHARYCSECIKKIVQNQKCAMCNNDVTGMMRVYI